MDLEQPQLAVFKYKHGGRVAFSAKRKTFMLISLAAALIAAFFAFPGGLMALVIPLGVFFVRQGTLALGPRYLVCGNDIVYFANVAQVALHEGEGRLNLKMASGATFTLERDKFPTNARKAHKVAANKAAKFNKVSAKIIEKVRRASPVVAGA
ncbi:hypothetical protein [Propionivibrio sp.]|uniref:hypothetical protein n=1 Tax=Propionivibrio sp. TaxID=2212460 RepID=UPI002609AB47|nr:hypothetical protein [Propionivibrio sp.]